MALKSFSRRLKRQQSTLTQLDFVSTPSAQREWPDSGRPLKRQRRDDVGNVSGRHATGTMTQLGFAHSGTAAEEEGQNDGHETDQEEQVIADSQPTPTEASVPGSPCGSVALPGGARSPDSGSEMLEPFKVPATPRRPRFDEARSSQTPPSALLSHRSTKRVNEHARNSPLKHRGVNFVLSPDLVQVRKLKRMNTVQDSQYEEPPLVDSAPSSPASIVEEPVMPDNASNKTTQMIEDYNTYDPADSALDRDAARCRWTQLMQSRMVDDTTVNDTDDTDDTDDSDDAETLPQGPRAAHGTRQSQISTVLPTQSSPRPPPSSVELITTPRALSSKPAMESTDQSSPLPAPPWTETEREGWLEEVHTTAEKVPVGNQTLPDFSLPPPPLLNWSSISSATR